MEEGEGGVAVAPGISGKGKKCQSLLEDRVFLQTGPVLENEDASRFKQFMTEALNNQPYQAFFGKGIGRVSENEVKLVTVSCQKAERLFYGFPVEDDRRFGGGVLGLKSLDVLLKIRDYFAVVFHKDHFFCAPA